MVRLKKIAGCSANPIWSFKWKSDGEGNYAHHRTDAYNQTVYVCEICEHTITENLVDRDTPIANLVIIQTESHGNHYET